MEVLVTPDSEVAGAQGSRQDTVNQLRDLGSGSQESRLHPPPPKASIPGYPRGRGSIWSSFPVIKMGKHHLIEACKVIS